MTAFVAPASRAFVALGANLPSDVGPPRRTLEHVVERLEGPGAKVTRRSRWYESEPVPSSAQPWFVNGVVELCTGLAPDALLARLHALERELGRRRRARWEARAVDLDLLDHGGLVRREAPPLLPHPRLSERLFVLLPLRDVAPGWRHPETGEPIDALLAALPADSPVVRPLGENGGGG